MSIEVIIGVEMCAFNLIQFHFETIMSRVCYEYEANGRLSNCLSDWLPAAAAIRWNSFDQFERWSFGNNVIH